MPQHVKTIETIEMYYQKTLNEKQKAEEDKNQAIANRKRGKGDFIPRREGETWIDEKGQKWQTIF